MPTFLSWVSAAVVALFVSTSAVYGQRPPFQVEPMPPATTEIQALINQVTKITATDAARALELADGVLTTARRDGDTSGEAQAHSLRADLLLRLKRPADSMLAWRNAEAAWSRLKDGPRQIQAIAWQAVLEGNAVAL